MVTYVTLTSGTSWDVPADCTGATVHCIGGGAGGDGSGSGGSEVGGGGAAYARKFVSLTPAASMSYAIGAQGVGGTNSANGTAGGDTNFNSNEVLAKGGDRPAGGLASQCVGDVAYDGGSAGSSGSQSTGPSGGGAAGSEGAGGDGSQGGGNVNGGVAGAGGDIDPGTADSGPGKGGNRRNQTSGSSGEKHGGGGATGDHTGKQHSAAGWGFAGCIVIEYTPFVWADAHSYGYYS